MPKDLRKFKNVKIDDIGSNEGRKKIKQQVGDVKLNQDQQEQMERLKENLSDYKDKSDKEIYADIKKMAKENKAKGTLDNKKLTSFANSVAPMLNDEQRDRLGQILKQLKKI